jgi:hypothetical protein
MRTSFVCAVVAVLLAMPLRAQEKKDDPRSADELHDRLDKYLLGYEPQLSMLIADEFMTQRARRQTRELNSEVAFIALPGGAAWLGFRRIITADGKNVHPQSAALGASLADGSRDDYARARQLLNEGAVMNLGLPRTTNLPNLPLEMLHPRHRRRFVHRLDGEETVGGVRTTRLMFIERITPTIIQSRDGEPMESVVRAWIEPSSGRLFRAEVKSRGLGSHEDFKNVVRVEFAPNQQFGMLVPSLMDEVFPLSGGIGTGRARYSNFRRFQTSARIITPPPQ